MVAEHPADRLPAGDLNALISSSGIRRIHVLAWRDFDDPEAVNQAAMLQEEIQRIVNEKLPDKCRTIFILSRIEGKSNPDIAELLDLSVRTVENQIYRALKVLKKNLKNYL